MGGKNKKLICVENVFDLNGIFVIKQIFGKHNCW